MPLSAARRLGIDRGTLAAQRQAVLKTPPRSVIGGLRSILVNPALDKADRRTAEMLRLIAKRFAENSTQPVF